MTAPPDSAVLASFGVSTTQGCDQIEGHPSTWQAGGIFFKRVTTVAEAEWVADVLDAVDESGFRVTRPIRSASGHWTTAGWTAWRHVSGQQDMSNRWGEVMSAGQAFHQAIRHLKRPDFLDVRNDAWSIGDRAAWSEHLPPVHDGFSELLLQYDALRSQQSEPSQIVHGDLTGNVLFAPGLAPAIIDFTPYWRPPTFASAVVIVDAIAWHGADPQSATLVAGDAPVRSMLARAAIYRLVTADVAIQAAPDDGTRWRLREQIAHQRVLAAISNW